MSTSASTLVPAVSAVPVATASGLSGLSTSSDAAPICPDAAHDYDRYFNGIYADDDAEPSPLPSRNWRVRFSDAFLNDKGMATLEYALVCVAAAAFAGLLYVIVSGGSVEEALRGIIEQALNNHH